MQLRGSPLAAHDRRLRERALGLSVAFLLQVGFLLMLTQSVLRPVPLKPGAARELILMLPHLPRPIPERRQNTTPAPDVAQVPPAFIPPSTFSVPFIAPTVPIAPSRGAIQGFGQALNNCAPENYANLPEDLRAKCQRPGAGVAIQELPSLMGTPSQVRDETRWQEELAREHSPTMLPCGGFINVACFLSKIVDGTWTDYGDPRTWPRYAVKQLAPEDFYKIEKEYDAWHKDHQALRGADVDPTSNQEKN